MREFLHRSRGFLIPAIPVLVICAAISIIFPRAGIHIWFNSHHAPWLDVLMKAWTLLGDGLWSLLIILIFLFSRLQHFFILLASYAFSGLFAQLLKRIFFEGMPRPVKYFSLNEIGYDLYLVPGVDVHSWHSFPSGHTATAFGVFLGISLILKSEWLKTVCFFIAAGVAWSRIYLSEHFLMDVTAGAILGMGSAFLSFWWLKRYRADWLMSPLHNAFAK